MQAGGYLESRAEMVDHQITKDEVRSVAATILRIPEGNETYDREFVGDGGIKFTCNILAIIDTSARVCRESETVSDKILRADSL